MYLYRYVPVEPLRQLRLISMLDLSGNRIKFVPNNAFVTLRLKTLKLGRDSIEFQQTFSIEFLVVN